MEGDVEEDVGCGFSFFGLHMKILQAPMGLDFHRSKALNLYSSAQQLNSSQSDLVSLSLSLTFRFPQNLHGEQRLKIV